MKKGEKKLSIIIIVVSVVSLAIVAGVYFSGTEGGGGNIIDGIFYDPNPHNSTIPYELFEPETLNRTVALESINPTYNHLTKDYRPRWDGCTDEQYLQIFGSLPKFPQDFYKRYAMFMRGELTDYDRLGSEYWLQPEFFDMGQGLFEYYIHRTTGMWTPGTVGCKPSVRQVEMKKGATVKLSTFFHTDAVGAEAYLGGVFFALLPDAAISYEGTVIFDQPANAGSYIQARIVEPDNDPIYMSEAFQSALQGLYTNVGENERILLFHPTYNLVDYQGTKRIHGFTSNWCYKISLEITVKSTTPSGTYVVAVDMKNPSDSINQEYNWVLSGSPYYGFYYPAIREWRPVCPYFQVVVVVP